MTARENEALVRSQIELYNGHLLEPASVEERLATLADDCEIIDVPSGSVSRGKEGFKQTYAFFKEAFADHRVEILNVVATRNQVVVEFVGRGTHSGPLRLPSGDIPSTGRHGELHCCNVYHLSKGKITRIQSYYCAKSLLEQVGVSIV